jgi:hypothetical protein
VRKGFVDACGTPGRPVSCGTAAPARSTSAPHARAAVRRHIHRGIHEGDSCHGGSLMTTFGGGLLLCCREDSKSAKRPLYCWPFVGRTWDLSDVSVNSIVSRSGKQPVQFTDVSDPAGLWLITVMSFDIPLHIHITLHRPMILRRREHLSKRPSRRVSRRATTSSPCSCRGWREDGGDRCALGGWFKYFPLWTLWGPVAVGAANKGEGDRG